MAPPTRNLSVIAALAIALAPAHMHGQAPGAPDEVVWHWFGACKGGDFCPRRGTLTGQSGTSARGTHCRSIWKGTES